MFRPMKPADVEDLASLPFPLYVSPKYDGIRAVVNGGKLYANSGLLIPNVHAQLLFGRKEFDRFDGELIYGDPCEAGCFNRTSSVVRGRWNQLGKLLTYYVFDIALVQEYRQRLAIVEKTLQVQHMMEPKLDVQLVPQHKVGTLEELLPLLDALVADGYEGGIMRRYSGGYYKHGRSTLDEAFLLRFKPTSDSEAEIIGMEEQMHNANDLQEDAHGYAKRSNHASGMVPAGVMGKLVVRDIYSGKIFRIGTGFSAAGRIMFWSLGPRANGRIIKYKYQKYGTVDLPRAPVYIGPRDAWDLTAY